MVFKTLLTIIILYDKSQPTALTGKEIANGHCHDDPLPFDSFPAAPGFQNSRGFHQIKNINLILLTVQLINL